MAVWRYGFCLAAVSGLIFACIHFFPANGTTVALLMLLLVLFVATRLGLAEAIFASVISVVGFNYFFLPPIHTFTIADPENWVALFTFFMTAFTVSQLSAMAKRRAEEAVAGRNELGKLYELSRAMLMDEARDAVRFSVARTGQILGLTHIAFYDPAGRHTYGSVEGSAITQDDLTAVARSGDTAIHGESTVIPVRMGTRVVGSLGLQGAKLSPTIRDSVASLLAINYERVRALDRAAAAEVARRNEEFKSSLLDGLAHDLKTPLTAIRTCVTRLITIPPRTEEVRMELLSIIDQESERLQQSITEAIQLARIESQELHLNPELTNAADLVYAALAGTRDENHDRYTMDIAGDLALQVDCDLFKRALLQILENARKYSPPGAPIRIEAREENGRAVILISDRGPGIGEDELDKVFDKFYRGRAGRTIVEGTGMGLAIAKGIVEAHGGTIRAANRPGGGAIISMSLPLTAVTSEHK